MIDLESKNNPFENQKPKFKNPQEDYRWYYGLPFSKFWNRGAKDYIKDRERYENQFLLESEKIRNNQEKMINGVSVLLIAILTTVWTALPGWLPKGQVQWLDWMWMGGHTDPSWMERVWFFIVPSMAGTVVHKAPNLIPHRKGRMVANVVIKSIPVLILTICYYLIHTEKQFWKYRKLEKAQVESKLKAQI